MQSACARTTGAGPHHEGRRLVPDPTTVLLVASDLALVALAVIAWRYG